jgi:hypothetical protein
MASPMTEVFLAAKADNVTVGTTISSDLGRQQ